ncbi:40S ribosomal protein S3-1-like protein [Tanacetum coccineum]
MVNCSSLLSRTRVLMRELYEDGYSGVEVRVTPMRTEIIIRATRTQNVLGEKGRRIRELTSLVQKRFKFPENSVELYCLGGGRASQQQRALSRIGYYDISGQPVIRVHRILLWNVLLRQGVLGIKVKIMLDWDPTGKVGPKTPLPDNVVIHMPKDDIVVQPPKEVEEYVPHVAEEPLPMAMPSPQSSMILHVDHVLRAVINARLPVPLLQLICFSSYLFHAVMLPYQVGDVPLTCIAAVDYVSGIHVASSDYWLASFFARLFKMTNFAVKHSIMTREMVENFCNNYYIPDEVHPVAPGRDKTITQFPEGKVGVYTRFFDYCGYRIPFTNFFMAVLRYFRIHISQLSPFGAARVSHFEVLTRVLDLAPSVTVFRAFYTRTYSDGLFSFAKRSTSSPSCFPKPPDFNKNWSDHFFWVDAKVFPIPVSLYVGDVLEKDPAPHLTARQEQIVRLMENNKAPFRQMGLLDFIKTADPRKVQAVEVQKKDDQVKLLESTSHCFMSLVTPAAGGSSSAAAPEVSAPAEVEPENVVPEDTYLDLTEPDEVATTQSGKSKRKRLVKQSDTLPTNARTADVPVYTAAAIVTFARENVGVTPTSDVAGSSQLETSEGSDDSFYELPTLNSAEAKRWYVPRWNITNDSLLDDDFSCRTLVDRVAPPGFFSTL